MIEYVAAAWLLSCAHLHYDDPLNPAPNPNFIRGPCIPFGPAPGMRLTWEGYTFCVKNETAKVGYISLVEFPHKIWVEMSSELQPCDGVPMS